MGDRFFQRPILNSPYGYPSRHWELDAQGQPTQQIIEKRRGAEFITPIPRPRKRTASAGQTSIVFDEGKARALDYVLVTSVEPASEFLDDLRTQAKQVS